MRGCQGYFTTCMCILYRWIGWRCSLVSSYPPVARETGAAGRCQKLKGSNWQRYKRSELVEKLRPPRWPKKLGDAMVMRFRDPPKHLGLLVDPHPPDRGHVDLKALKALRQSTAVTATEVSCESTDWMALCLEKRPYTASANKKKAHSNVPMWKYHIHLSAKLLEPLGSLFPKDHFEASVCAGLECDALCTASRGRLICRICAKPLPQGFPLSLLHWGDATSRTRFGCNRAGRNGCFVHLTFLWTWRETTPENDNSKQWYCWVGLTGRVSKGHKVYEKAWSHNIKQKAECRTCCYHS